MTPKIEIINEPLNITGVYVKTNNQNEFNPDTAKIMRLWEEFHSSTLPQHAEDHAFYGLYSDYQSDEKGEYIVTAGVNSNSLEEQENFHKIQINPGKYLVFKAQGKMPEAIIETWQFIWKYFEDTSNPKRKFTTDFEKYISETEAQIYIALED